MEWKTAAISIFTTFAISWILKEAFDLGKLGKAMIEPSSQADTEVFVLKPGSGNTLLILLCSAIMMPICAAMLWFLLSGFCNIHKKGIGIILFGWGMGLFCLAALWYLPYHTIRQFRARIEISGQGIRWWNFQKSRSQYFDWQDFEGVEIKHRHTAIILSGLGAEKFKLDYQWSGIGILYFFLDAHLPDQAWKGDKGELVTLLMGSKEFSQARKSCETIRMKSEISSAEN